MTFWLFMGGVFVLVAVLSKCDEDRAYDWLFLILAVGLVIAMAAMVIDPRH